jgi:predicted Zn finger-like uncharacterized protein
MIITCPSCQTNFMLSASALGTEGRKVRCAKCGHEWHAMPEAKAEVPELTETPPLAEEENSDIDIALLDALTAAANPKPARSLVQEVKSDTLWKVAAGVFSIVLLVLSLIALRESLYPALSPVYHAMGYYPTQGVTLADVKLRELPSRRKQRYEIECNILNQSASARVVPQLSMQIQNEFGEVLAEEASFLENTGQPLAKGGKQPCRGLRFENVFSTAHHLVMELGSPMELSLRSEWDYPEEENEKEESAETEEAEHD